MALLPENVAAGQTGHVSHTNQIHKKLNGRIDVRADYGALGDNSTDDGPAIQAAIDAAAPLVGTKYEQAVYFPPGNYLTNQAITSDEPVAIVGAGRLASRIGIGPSFPAGGTLFTFTRSAVNSSVQLESHVPGLIMRDLTLDGRLRSIQAHALKVHRFDRLELHIGINAFDGSALVSTHSMRESHISGLRTWLCGNPTSPTVDLDQTAADGTEGANLNTFHGCHILYSLGDQLRIRAEAGVVHRNNSFVQCVFHGLDEWIDDYYDDFGTAITLTHEGNLPCRIVLDNARNTQFIGGRMRLAGRGQPMIYLSNARAGSSTVNSVFISGCGVTYRGNAYSTRTLSTVDATADTLSLVGVQTNKHHLQTGSRVRLTGSMPTPLVADTDYYVIRVNTTTFKLATTRANANAGTAINLTDTTTGGSLIQYDTAGAASAAADTLTMLDHRLTTGARFRVDGASVPGGLAAATDYFVIRIDKDTIKLATTRANAVAGTAVDITSTGTDVYISPQDFLGDTESGRITLGDNNWIDTHNGGSAPTRGLFRVESGGPEVITGITNNWSAGLNSPVSENAGGTPHYYPFAGDIWMTRNASSIFTNRTDGTRISVLRMTATNTVQVGTLTGSDNAQLVAAGTATVIGGGTSERFRAGATGVSFNGVAAQVARRTVAAAATDAATTQALVNELRTLLIDLGLAQ